MNRLEREEEMRRKFPKMFTHPGLQPGEVWVGDQAFDFAMINTATCGMPSARFEEESRMMVRVIVNGVVENVPGHSIIVKLDELITAIEKRELEHSAEEPRV